MSVAARLVVFLSLSAACGSDPPGAISYGAMGPISGDAGKGSFRFGAASAATQIEDMNDKTDWYLWTQPVAQGGLGKATFVGNATRGYSKVMEDLALVKSLGLEPT